MSRLLPRLVTTQTFWSAVSIIFEWIFFVETQDSQFSPDWALRSHEDLGSIEYLVIAITSKSTLNPKW